MLQKEYRNTTISAKVGRKATNQTDFDQSMIEQGSEGGIGARESEGEEVSASKDQMVTEADTVSKPFRKEGAPKPSYYPTFVLFMLDMEDDDIVITADEIPLDIDQWENLIKRFMSIVTSNLDFKQDDAEGYETYLKQIGKQLRKTRQFLMIVTYPLPGFSDYYYYNLRRAKSHIYFANFDYVDAVQGNLKDCDITPDIQNVDKLYEVIESFIDLRNTHIISVKKNFETEYNKILFMIMHENGNVAQVKIDIIELAKKFDKLNEKYNLFASAQSMCHLLLSGYPVETYLAVSNWWTKLKDTTPLDRLGTVEQVLIGIEDSASNIDDKLLGVKEIFTSPSHSHMLYNLIMEDKTIPQIIKKHLVKPVTSLHGDSKLPKGFKLKYYENNKELFFKLRNLVKDRSLCSNCLEKHDLSECTDRLNPNGLAENLGPIENVFKKGKRDYLESSERISKKEKI